MQGYFVTGTDTGVGKTFVSELLIYRLRGTHARVAGFKPVASGCVATPLGPRNADALTLQRASSIELSYAQVNPYAFAAPIAPHLAAAEAGVTIDLDAIERAIVAVTADRVVVEGVGGWLAPLGTDIAVADLARSLGLPVILVVGMRLGCINHALLSMESIRRYGLPVAGWVANSIDPGMERVDANISALRDRLDAPLLCDLPWCPNPVPETLAADLFSGLRAR
ncbi:MAG: dethiobiotin synthase [Thiohalobacteraceae bacterium]